MKLFYAVNSESFSQFLLFFIRFCLEVFMKKYKLNVRTTSKTMNLRNLCINGMFFIIFHNMKVLSHHFFYFEYKFHSIHKSHIFIFVIQTNNNK